MFHVNGCLEYCPKFKIAKQSKLFTNLRDLGARPPISPHSKVVDKVINTFSYIEPDCKLTFCKQMHCSINQFYSLFSKTLF